MKKFSLLLFALLFVFACTSGGKPRDVVLDRDVCERCAMQINDARFVAQAVHNTDGTTHMFIEMGCAVIWLQAMGKDTYTLYLADIKRPGAWLLADKAVFAIEYNTPMGYGIAAMATEADLEEGKSIITYAEAIERIHSIDRQRHNKQMGSM